VVFGPKVAGFIDLEAMSVPKVAGLIVQRTYLGRKWLDLSFRGHIWTGK